MKKCKLIHINDGNPREIRNCDRLFMEDIPRVEDLLDHWINKGWVVKQMMPLYEPNQLEQGAIGFYLSGINVYLEKEFPDDYTAEDAENDFYQVWTILNARRVCFEHFHQKKRLPHGIPCNSLSLYFAIISDQSRGVLTPR